MTSSPAPRWRERRVTCVRREARWRCYLKVLLPGGWRYSASTWCGARRRQWRPGAGLGASGGAERARRPPPAARGGGKEGRKDGRTDRPAGRTHSPWGPPRPLTTSLPAARRGPAPVPGAPSREQGAGRPAAALSAPLPPQPPGRGARLPRAALTGKRPAEADAAAGSRPRGSALLCRAGAGDPRRRAVREVWGGGGAWGLRRRVAAARSGGAPRLGAPLPCLRREGSRRLGSGGRPSTLPPGPPPRLGPPRSRGPGPCGLGSDSFIPGGREPRTCGAPERRGKRAAANEGPRASRAPLCWAAGAGQGLREGAGACPPPPAPRSPAARRPQPAACLEMAPSVLVGRRNRSCPACSPASPPPPCSES